MPWELACEVDRVAFEASSVLWNRAAEFSDSLLAMHGANPELGSGGKSMLQDLGVPV